MTAPTEDRFTGSQRRFNSVSLWRALLLSAPLVLGGCAICGYSLGFPGKACDVERRAADILTCSNVNVGAGHVTNLRHRSFADVDRYVVCCAKGSRDCVQYVCPKGADANACWRE